jgi:hypothetical protein
MISNDKIVQPTILDLVEYYMSHPKILILGRKYLFKYFYPISKSSKKFPDFSGFFLNFSSTNPIFSEASWNLFTSSKYFI